MSATGPATSDVAIQTNPAGTTNPRVREILELQAGLLNERRSYESQWQDIVDLVLPTKSNVRRFQQPGARRGIRRFDDTGTDSNERLASAMSSNLTNPAVSWNGLRWREAFLNEARDVQVWTEDSHQRMYAALADSNFYPTIDETYIDLGGFGTGAITTLQRPPNEDGTFGGLRFQTWDIKDYQFTETEDGLIDRVIRERWMTARQAQQLFQNHAGFRGTLGKSVDKSLGDTSQEAQRTRYAFVQYLGPREQRDRRRQTQDQMPIAQLWINKLDGEVVTEGGFWENPVAIARWRKNSNDAGWGRGPGITALPSIYSLNEMARLELKAAGKDIDPPLKVPDGGVVGQVNTAPGALTYIRREDIGLLEPLYTGGRYDVGRFKREEMQRQVRRAFHIDQLEQVTGEPTPNMTATEYLRRLELMRRALGPVLGRLERELLSPIVIRVFNIMLRAGAFRPLPQTLLDAANRGMPLELDVDYIGPLSRAQKLEDVDAIDQAIEWRAGVANATGSQAVFDDFDMDRAARERDRLLGVPANLTRDPREVAQIRQNRQQQQEQQRQLDALEQTGRAAQTFGQAQAAGGQA